MDGRTEFKKCNNLFSNYFLISYNIYDFAYFITYNFINLSNQKEIFLKFHVIIENLALFFEKHFYHFVLVAINSLIIISIYYSILITINVILW